MTDTFSYPVNKTTQSATNAFNWVERYITPSMFATPDSVLIGFLNTPLKANSSIGAEIPLLGMCESFSISQANNVVTLKELRSERTIIIPSKSQPGSISITRLLGLGPNFIRAVGNYSDNKWRMNMQNVDSKQLFSIVIMFLTADRTQTISTLYAERCTVQSSSISVQGGQTCLMENVNILFDRLVDDCSDAPSVSSAAESILSTGAGGELDFFSAAAKATQTINKVKATFNALRSVNIIGTGARAVSYAEDLLDTYYDLTKKK